MRIIWKNAIVGLFWISPHLSGRTEGNHENSQRDIRFPNNFETGTHRMKIRGVTDRTGLFGDSLWTVRLPPASRLTWGIIAPNFPLTLLLGIGRNITSRFTLRVPDAAYIISVLDRLCCKYLTHLHLYISIRHEQRVGKSFTVYGCNWHYCCMSYTNSSQDMFLLSIVRDPKV
jgi:hypothetical protein